MRQFEVDYETTVPPWHTGHELQRENYRYILEKILEVPWLGVIFKPKRSIRSWFHKEKVDFFGSGALCLGRRLRSQR
jgi:hypothetical protein